MRGLVLLTCCWPGLSRLWLRGDAAGFLPAVGFAAAVNATMWLTWGAERPLALGWQVAVWLVVFLVWLAFAWRAYHNLPTLLANDIPAADEDLFIRAQAEYLRGNWFEAEGLAARIGRLSDDVEAQLLLSSIYRRMKRFDEAQARLQNLVRQPAAVKWTMEIEHEQRLLDRLAAQQQTQEQGNPENQAAENDPPETMARAA